MTTNIEIGDRIFAGLSPFSPITADAKHIAKTYKGFLFVKAQLMCTRSEGPDYYLQPYGDEQTEIKILKHGADAPFMHDLTLDGYLLTKVIIVGVETPTGVKYLGIRPFDCLSGPKDVEKPVFDGYLYAKLDNIGTRSEGPSYYLQQFDYTEIHVVKDCDLSENDPKLHPLLNTKVTVTGKLENGELIYTATKPFEKK